MAASRGPWIKFYPSDWRSDPALRACSISARGLWMECICLMHEADPYGHLLINGRPPTDAQLSSLAGAPVDQIPGLLDELENAGVFSRTRTRVIYSRRMTRDEKRRKDGEKSQQTGGKVPSSRRAQAAENKKEKLPPPGVVGGVTERPPPHPEARSQKPEEKQQAHQPEPRARLPSEAVELRVAIAAAFEAVGRMPPDTSRAEVWTAQGLDPKICLAVVRECLAKRPDISTLAYCDKPIQDAHQNRGKPRTAAAVDWKPQPKPVPWWELPEPERRWMSRSIARRYLVTCGDWPREYGPRIGDPGCKVDRDHLVEFRIDPDTGKRPGFNLRLRIFEDGTRIPDVGPRPESGTAAAA